MKAILRSSQLSYELLEKITLQIRAAKEKGLPPKSNLKIG